MDKNEVLFLADLRRADTVLNGHTVIIAQKKLCTCPYELLVLIPRLILSPITDIAIFIEVVDKTDDFSGDYPRGILY